MNEWGSFVVRRLGSFGSSFFGDFATLAKAYGKINKVASAVMNMARTPTRIFSGKDIASTGFGGLANFVSVSL